MGAKTTCSIAIVTFNSAAYIGQCLQVLADTQDQDLPVVVVDNCSTDNTRDILEKFAHRVRVVFNPVNNGFAAGQNQAIALTGTPWVLTLNPDVRVQPDFVNSLVASGESDERVGVVCGKLLSMAPDFSISKPDILDSTGIVFTPELRHFDRGSKQPDTGQFNRPEYVFGATGAAALFRRAMIEDVSLGGEFFDEDFFAYREDADLAWRAQLFGWRCLYTPRAVAYHVRSVLPTNRRQVSAVVKYHSVKNRFLMRIKNIDGDLYRRHFAAVTWRDLLVLGGCLLHEHSSLPAFTYIVRNWHRTWAKRRVIQARRRISSASLAPWFEARQ